MSSYVVFDLDRIADDLGSHFEGSRAEEYTAICPVCNEEVPQDVDECEVCGEPVVWKNSKLWKRKFGSPTVAIRNLDIIEPREPAGKLICKRAGIDGFANKSEAKRWGRCIRHLGQEKMIEIVEICAKSVGKWFEILLQEQVCIVCTGAKYFTGIIKLSSSCIYTCQGYKYASCKEK